MDGHLHIYTLATTLLQSKPFYLKILRTPNENAAMQNKDHMTSLPRRSNLSCKLLPRSLPSSGFASSLLGTSHLKMPYFTQSLTTLTLHRFYIVFSTLQYTPHPVTPIIRGMPFLWYNISQISPEAIFGKWCHFCHPQISIAMNTPSTELRFEEENTNNKQPTETIGLIINTWWTTEENYVSYMWCRLGYEMTIIPILCTVS